MEDKTKIVIVKTVGAICKCATNIIGIAGILDSGSAKSYKETASNIVKNDKVFKHAAKRKFETSQQLNKTTIFTKKADIERLKKDSEMFGTALTNRVIKDIKLAKVVTYLKMTAYTASTIAANVAITSGVNKTIEILLNKRIDIKQTKNKKK